MSIQEDAEVITSFTQWWSITGHHTPDGEPLGFQVRIRLTGSYWSQTGDDIEAMMHQGRAWVEGEMKPKIKKRPKR